MIISALRILELNERYHLIDGLGERDSLNPEGIDLDLRVGKVEKIVGESFLGVTERSSALTTIIGDVEKDGNKQIRMEPGDYFMVSTIEKINCPSEKVVYEQGYPAMHIIPDIKPRVSLQKAGVSLHCSTTNPGYSGKLVFGIRNGSKYPFTFELGARMFKIYWQTVIGDIKRPYTGQHQGGRSTSQGEREVQT
jgi:deoxycytidine triphosphate deaminase